MDCKGWKQYDRASYRYSLVQSRIVWSFLKEDSRVPMGLMETYTCDKRYTSIMEWRKQMPTLECCSNGESFRLFPDVLCQVDPQSFWNAVLWIDALTNTQELNVSAVLVDAWKALKDGEQKSQAQFQEYADFVINSVRPLRDRDEYWETT